MRIKALIVLSFLCLSSNLVFGANGIIPGTGTQSAPYLIEDFTDFQTFSNPANASTYWTSGIHTKLMCNLDLNPELSDREVYLKAPIACDQINNGFSFDGTPYTGKFNGNNMTISNLKIDTNYFCGLFGKTESGCEIINLTIEQANITNSNAYTGILVAHNSSGTISNCHSTGHITSEKDYVGGLVGHSDSSTINNCFSAASTIGENNIGGLLGRSNEDIISNCYSTGSANGNINIGGLIGHSSSGTINNCYSTASVVGKKWYIGGLVGKNDNVIINNCYSTNSVSGKNNIGGLIGYNSIGTINNCYSNASVTGTDDVGGLVGNHYSGTISNCYSTGQIITGSYVSGLIGIQRFGSIENSFWDINTSGIPDPQAGSPDTDGMIGKTTNDMQTQSSFTNNGWDFNAETANNTEDIWHMPYNTSGYPMLYWQRDIPGDSFGKYGVDLQDYAILALKWINEHNLNDFIVLTTYWLEGK